MDATDDSDDEKDRRRLDCHEIESDHRVDWNE